MVAYHDEEWGTPCHDDVELFERLALESFQAGLSWSTILRKREAFRTAFSGFDAAVVAAFDDGDRQRLMADAAIVRNRAKIDATIGNAAAWLETAAEFFDFGAGRPKYGCASAFASAPSCTCPRAAAAPSRSSSLPPLRASWSMTMFPGPVSNALTSSARSVWMRVTFAMPPRLSTATGACEANRR